MCGTCNQSTEAPPLPSRPLAGRVGRRSEAATDGVGGLHLLMRLSGRLTPAPHKRRPPPPTPPRHSPRSRGEGSGKCFVACAVALLTFALTSSPGVAQDYPTRPITLVVPFPPGGTNNIMARAVADKLSQTLGQPVVVENRAGGAAGTIATRQFTKSAPDGYTLLLAYTSNLASGPNLFPDVGYDPRKDFAPVGLVALAPAVLVVHPSLPVHSVAELIALMRKTGPTFQFASPGVGTVNHLALELFAQKAGVKFTHIPYKSSGSAMTDLIGGHNLVQFTPIPAARGAIAGGLIRALAVTGPKRSPLLPDVPTVSEFGPARLRSIAALRDRGAGGHAARDHRAAQQGAQRGAGDRRCEAAHSRRWRRAGREHARRIRRGDRSRGDDVGRVDQVDRAKDRKLTSEQSIASASGRACGCGWRPREGARISATAPSPVPDVRAAGPD